MIGNLSIITLKQRNPTYELLEEQMWLGREK